MVHLAVVLLATVRGEGGSWNKPLPGNGAGRVVTQLRSRVRRREHLSLCARQRASEERGECARASHRAESGERARLVKKRTPHTVRVSEKTQELRGAVATSSCFSPQDYRCRLCRRPSVSKSPWPIKHVTREFIYFVCKTLLLPNSQSSQHYCVNVLFLTWPPREDVSIYVLACEYRTFVGSHSNVFLQFGPR